MFEIQRIKLEIINDHSFDFQRIKFEIQRIQFEIQRIKFEIQRIKVEIQGKIF